MGILGALVAGLSLPMAFGNEGGGEDDDKDRGDTDAPTAGADDLESADGSIEAELDAAEFEAGFTDADEAGVLADGPDGASFFAAPMADATETSAGDPGDDWSGDPLLDGTDEDQSDAFSAVVDDGEFEVIDSAGPSGQTGDGPQRTDDARGDGEGAKGGADDGQNLGGSVGDDYLLGGKGDDTLYGDYGDDVLVGDGGDDMLVDGAGNDTLIGGAGNDVLIANTADGEAAQDGRDVLDGGAGDDELRLSASDSATGGAGADSFLLGPGLAAAPDTADAPAPTIEDFDGDEDALVVVWNDYASAEPPELSLMPDPDDPDLTHLMGDGEVLAEIRATRGVSLDEVHLRPASSL
ncbi:MAG: calcium-binding protein [Pseudomonadota bacterium]